MKWVEVESPPGKKVPKWQRSAGLSDTGVVFVPAAIAGDEMNILLCAGYDGTSVIHYLKHVFVPADWLAVEFPEKAEICKIISKSVREACS